MKSMIRKLEASEIPSFVEIVVNAYPGMMQQTVEFKERLTNSLTHLLENEEKVDFFGLFRGGKLLGGMRIHHFTLNVYGQLLEAGGVGLVAVDLLHKKEKVAKDLLQYYISYFKARGVSLLMLYPFKAEFYKKMGFGYGSKMHQYQIEPSGFPKLDEKKGLLFLDHSHKEQIQQCYNRYAKATHGMILKEDYELEALFKNPNHKVVGYLHGNSLAGYIVFTFERSSNEHFLINDLVIKELIYETPEALAMLCHFLHTQADQIRRIIWNTQDDALEYLIKDLNNGSGRLIPSVYHEIHTSGTGLMYKVVDLKGFLEQQADRSLNQNQLSCTFKLVVHDSLQSYHPQSWLLTLNQGNLSVTQHDSVVAEVEIEIDISDLSSLLMGAVDVKKLYEYGLLKLNDPTYLERVSAIFQHQVKPICLTAF